MAEESTPLTVRVKFMGGLRAVVGRRDQTVDLPRGSTLRALFSALADKHGEPFTARVFGKDGALEDYMLVFVNGHDIKELAGLGTNLNGEEVEIVMLPVIEGG